MLPRSNQFPHYQPPPVSMAMPPPRMYGPPGQQVSLKFVCVCVCVCLSVCLSVCASGLSM